MIKFENKNNGRFYYLQITRDMLNDLVLTIIRGGSHVRVVRHFGFNCRQAMQEEIERISERRLKRGYELIR